MKANTLLREITHIFITYLSKDQGGQNTQVAVKAPIASFDKHPKKGEAGYKLEKEVFGGTMNYMMDPDTGTKIDEVCSHMVSRVSRHPLGSKLMHTPVRRALPLLCEQPMEDSAGDNQEDY